MDFNDIDLFMDNEDDISDRRMNTGADGRQKGAKIEIWYSWVLCAIEKFRNHVADVDGYVFEPYSGYDGGLKIRLELPANICAFYKKYANTRLMLTGKILRTARGYIFEFAPDYKTETRTAEGARSHENKARQPDILPLYMESYNERILPFIDYCVRKKTYLRIIGDTNYDEGCVIASDILLGSGGAMTDRMQNAIVEGNPRQPLLRRIIRNMLVPETQAQREKYFKTVEYSTTEEIALLLEFSRDNYPPDIIRLADKGFVQHKNSLLSSNEKKHALKALMYLLNINWNSGSCDIPEIDEIERILDSEFVGLVPVKCRIMEIAAQIKQTGKLPERGILLCGPAGVGKTSIVQAIIRIFGRPGIKLDINAIGDGESLSGSSRIYENAKTGLILDRIYAEHTANVIMEISEIDKTTSGGEKLSPLSVLLTLIEKNGFIDNFVEGPIPTGGILFVATCNEPEKLSKPLLDRFFRIDIPAYTAAEKCKILTEHTVPKLLSTLNISPDDFSLSDSACELLCSEYAIEPGARDLNTYCENILSNYLLEKRKGGPSSVRHTAASIKALLGPGRAVTRTFAAHPGMAITSVRANGAFKMMPIEAAVRRGSGKFVVLGASQNEVVGFCEVAYACIKNSIDFDFSKIDVSVFFPETVSGVSGNQYGIAVYAAILSAITKTTFPADAAFIGGCDLLGNTYFEDPSVDRYLWALAGKNVKLVYAPLGCGKLIYNCNLPPLELVEAVNIQMLLRTAIYSAASIRRKDQ